MYAPLITGIFGKTLHMIDRKILQLDNIGGVILFSHNFTSRDQIKKLIDDIQAIRVKNKLPKALILIDHEGGVVQRLNSCEFTSLPSAAQIGQIYQKNPDKARLIINSCAKITAYELNDIGINVCLAPVLDLLKTNTKEDRSRFFSDQPDVIFSLAAEYISVLQNHGILAVAKHFPGIGSSKTNTHYSTSISESELDELIRNDLAPYIQLQNHGLLLALMTAHRVYHKIDQQPVSTSSKWMRDILRDKLHYQGLAFTDCIQMGGANIMGTNLESKIFNSLKAGCDFILSSQTPFGYYTEMYRIVMSKTIDEYISSNTSRKERVSQVFNLITDLKKSRPLSNSDYLSARDYLKNMNKLFINHRVQTNSNSNSLPILYRFKMSIYRNKRLKKYIKKKRLFHLISFYSFRMRMMIVKIKYYFTK